MDIRSEENLKEITLTLQKIYAQHGKSPANITSINNTVQILSGTAFAQVEYLEQSNIWVLSSGHKKYMTNSWTSYKKSDEPSYEKVAIQLFLAWQEEEILNQLAVEGVKC
jgi:hypothetical protein